MKQIEGYENHFITKNGNVIRVACIIERINGRPLNLKLKVLKYSNINGYLRVTLSANSNRNYLFVHRLVAIAFIPNPLNKPNVNHINGIRSDNRIENLEWCTQSENVIHSYSILGNINPRRKLSNDSVLDILLNCNKGESRNEYRCGNVSIYAKKYSVNKSTIIRVLNKASYKEIAINLMKGMKL